MDRLDINIAEGSAKPDGWHETLFGKSVAGDEPDPAPLPISGDAPATPAWNGNKESSEPDFPFSAEEGPYGRERFDNAFQAHLILRGDGAEALLAEIEAAVTATEQRQRRRKLRDLATFRRTLNSVIANAFWGDYFPAVPGIWYYRKNDKYRRPFTPDWLTAEIMRQAVDGAARAGLLDVNLGEGRWNGRAGTCSTFRLASALHDHLVRHVGFRNLAIELADAPLIVLKDCAGQKQDVDIDANPQVRAMADRVMSYNAFLTGSALALSGKPAEHAEIERVMSERAQQAPMYGQRFRYRRRPEYFRTNLYRVFNHGRWDHGGRFYGGWWQEIPSGWRPYITIDDEPTVEWDYSGFAVRAIYHRRGIDYRDGPYDLPQLTALNLGDDYEPERKRLLLAMINCPAEKDLLRVKIGRKLPRRARRTWMIGWFREKHAAIASSFQTGEGIRLQCLEAEIVDAILARGREAGIVVLPVHDSYLVSVQHEQWLKDQMNDRYREIFGFTPIIKRKAG